MEKYIIVGGGPTGLSLAYLLGVNGHHIELYEQNGQLGGSWNSQWIDDLYWSENAPRVLGYSGNTKFFLNLIGIKNSDLEDIYGNYITTNLKIVSFIWNYFTIKDYLIFSKSILKYKFYMENITVKDWFIQSGLSEKAKEAINTVCITIADRPDKTNINDFFGSMDSVTLKQFKDSNKWHQLVENKLNNFPNVKIFKNTRIDELYEKKNKISGVLCVNLKSGIKSTSYCDKVFFCTQSTGILNILNNSKSNLIKNNWIDYDWIKKWCESTFYSGFGFQLHFKEKIKFPEKWCWSCIQDWTVIILPVSNWLTKYSKNNKIKTVWSCCIVDMDSQSKFLKKTANECHTKQEVIKECMRQIKTNFTTLPTPYKITFSEGLYKDNNKWISENTGFTSSTKGYLPIKGKINNLYALGCFTKQDKPSISYMETAISASIKYIRLYENKIYKKNFNKNFNKNKLVIIICLVLLISIIIFYLTRRTF
jgi:hypothetical protein